MSEHAPPGPDLDNDSDTGQNRLLADQDKQTDSQTQEASGQRAVEPGQSRFARLRRFIVPVLTLLLLAIVLITFRTVLLPFIFACIIVYLMEPIVSRMSDPGAGRRSLPRWAAVVLVYIGFLAIVSTSVVFMAPRFLTEIVRFIETTPEAVQEFRNEKLPGINRDLQSYLRSNVTLTPEIQDLKAVKKGVREAREHAANVAAAMARAQAEIAVATQVKIHWDLVGEPGDLHRRYIGRVPAELTKALPVDNEANRNGRWSTEGGRTAPLFRMEPDELGGYAFYLEGDAVEIVSHADNVWTIRREDTSRLSIDDAQKDLDVHRMFDLERSFDDLIEGFTTITSARISSIMVFAQTFLAGVIQMLVEIMLTLMVAAFISIDLPRTKRVVRAAVPRGYGDAYDELLKRVDVRLGGVVRGQLIICVVNGLLTYLGLVILNIKYSMLLAVVAAVLSIIPIFGAILSTVPIVLIAITQSFTVGLLAIGWILLVHFVEANFLNPKIIGSTAQIHPVFVIFVLLAGQSTFGLVGAILAIPIASIVLTILGFVRDSYMEETMDPELENPTHENVETTRVI